jgi:hypothetical protein
MILTLPFQKHCVLLPSSLDSPPTLSLIFPIITILEHWLNALFSRNACLNRVSLFGTFLDPYPCIPNHATWSGYNNLHDHLTFVDSLELYAMLYLLSDF